MHNFFCTGFVPSHEFWVIQNGDFLSDNDDDDENDENNIDSNKDNHDKGTHDKDNHDKDKQKTKTNTTKVTIIRTNKTKFIIWTVGGVLEIFWYYCY